ncbi:WD40 repeat domain-containing serine/threonine-protein kinase [Stieleria sp. TO1_6]|uniref:WD40 repeat domain-containing serine/threonine-protein kinase n=1 Tax=Stieleria tagensis TaxID=2956795 RepID=UPI00209A9812|nr:WD40 repeat domain-containing serine/threonine-protein kinase [Stieleria tagensis]MCO8124281.1 WD40 repeat domain-containing serine/threonine-protein kinase [Stieleria tagensis]
MNDSPEITQSSSADSSEPRSKLATELDAIDAGQYEIIRMIGRGGMSRVYEARRIVDDSTVALKLLNTDTALSSSVQQRFRREAEAIASLHHDHIVPLLAYHNELAGSYLVLKLIDGCTLAELAAALPEDFSLASSIDEGESQTVSCAYGHAESKALQCFAAAQIHRDECKDLAELIADAADALHAAHQQGIVHRDVKPSNLMLDRMGHLWLMDFGLASLGDAHTVVTQTGQIIGTPHYMSPEQASGEHDSVDHRSDVYSLGATLYELVTRQRPHRGNRFRVLMEISTGKLTPPSKIRHNIPRPLEAIILSAMSFKASDRYANAAELARDLRRYASGDRIVARQPGPADHLVSWITRNPKTFLLSALGVAFAVLLALLVQFVGSKRLALVNDSLDTSNNVLAKTNVELARVNQHLDHSRNRLRRHLYVADVAAAYHAFTMRDTDEVNQLLDRHILDASELEDESPDQRGFEWWLLKNLCRPPAMIELGRHAAAATAVTVVPGTDQIWSAGEDGWLRRWDLNQPGQTGGVMIGGELNSIAIAPDNSMVMTGRNVEEGDNPVVLYNLNRDETQGDSSQLGDSAQGGAVHQNAIESVAFSADGRWIASADRYQHVLLQDTQGQVLGRCLTDSRNESLAFAPGGQSLVGILRQDRSTRQQAIAVWGLPDLKQQDVWRPGFDPLIFGFSDTGNRIVIADADQLRLATWPDLEIIASETDIRGRIRSIALDSTGTRIAVGCDNGLLHLWQLDKVLTAAPQQNTALLLPDATVFTTGDQPVKSLVFANDQTIVAALRDGAVRAWTLPNDQDADSTFGFPIHGISDVTANDDVAFVRDHRGDIFRLSFSTRQLDRIATLPKDTHSQIAASSDRQRVAASAPDAVVVFSANDGSEQLRMKSQADDSDCVDLDFMNDDQQLLVLFDDRFRCYQMADGSVQSEVLLDTSGAEQLTVSPDGEQILVLTRNHFLTFDAATLMPQQQQLGRLGEYTIAKYSGSGQTIAVGHQDGSIELLDAVDYHSLGLLRGHRASVSGISFTQHDQTLVSVAGDQTIRFWDVGSGRGLGVLPIDDTVERGFQVYCPHLETLFSMGCNQPIKFWSGQTGQLDR